MKQIISIISDLIAEVANSKIEQEKNRFLKLYALHTIITVVIVFFAVNLSNVNYINFSSIFDVTAEKFFTGLALLVVTILTSLNLYQNYSLQKKINDKNKTTLKDVTQLVELAGEIFAEFKDKSLKEAAENNELLKVELLSLKQEILRIQNESQNSESISASETKAGSAGVRQS